MPEEVEGKLKKELRRLSKQPFGSAEASVLRNYLDVCLELPWNVRTKERLNVAAARKVLDSDHYGLEKVKERILEFLAVKQLAPDLRGQIICLVGPPGVGKTSIAYSVAKATNRRMARILWVVFTMRRRFADTAKLISAPCLAELSVRFKRPAVPIR